MTVSLDKKVLETASMDEFFDALKEAEVGVEVTDLPLEGSILWSRKVLSLDEVCCTCLLRSSAL